VRAVRFHARGGADVLRVEEVPEPEPGPGEVRVRVRAAALNRLDVWVRRGLPIRMEMPHIGGADFAGVVDATGAGVASLAPGRKVVGYPVLGAPFDDGGRLREPVTILGEQRNGAFCEAIVLPERNLVPLPEGLSFEEAAALPVVFLTAWRMLAERAALRPGETLLVQGAASGVGTAAVQIGRLLGARVLACARTAKLDRVRGLEPDAVIDASEEPVALRVMELTDRRGADVVFEHVGEATWKESVAAAAAGGRIVTCGATTGRFAPTDLTRVFALELSILGVTLGSREALATVLDHVAAGRLRPVIDRVLPLAECARGHELLEAGEVFGKIVLKVAEG